MAKNSKGYKRCPFKNKDSGICTAADTPCAETSGEMCMAIRRAYKDGMDDGVERAREKLSHIMLIQFTRSYGRGTGLTENCVAVFDDRQISEKTVLKHLKKGEYWADDDPKKDKVAIMPLDVYVNVFRGGDFSDFMEV